MFIIEWTNGVIPLVLVLTFWYASRTYYLEQFEKAKTRTYDTAKFVLKNECEEEWGISNLGWNVFYSSRRRRLGRYYRVRWDIMVLLFTRHDVCRPVLVQSKERDIEKAAMEAVTNVYSLAGKKSQVWALLYEELDGNQIRNSIRIPLSKTISARLDITKK